MKNLVLIIILNMSLMQEPRILIAPFPKKPVSPFPLPQGWAMPKDMIPFGWCMGTCLLK